MIRDGLVRLTRHWTKVQFRSPRRSDLLMFGLPRPGHFEGLSERQYEVALPITACVVRWGDTRKTMRHNNLHYLAAATIFGDRVTGGAGPPGSYASFQDSRPRNDVPRPVENRGFTSFRWIPVHPEPVLLRRAQNLPVYLFRRDGALRQYNNGPMSAPVRGSPREDGERRVTA